MEINALKLNIGSSHPKGKYRHSDWINIDVSPEFDGQNNVIKMDACDMPEDWENHFETIHAVHVLEHINRNYQDRFVSECYRVTKPGGQVYIEVPDFEQIVYILQDAMKNSNHIVQHNMTTSIYGKQRYPGDQHCWGFTWKTLKSLMERVGFKHIDVYTDEYPERMISSHYKQEPVLLAVAIK